MKKPELRLIAGEDSAMNQFKAFVIAHSAEVAYCGDEVRVGEYELQDRAQLVPIDRVDFRVTREDNLQSYSIGLRSSADYLHAPVFEIMYDDHPTDPQFYDERVEPLTEADAARLISGLTEAERAGCLLPLS